MLKDILGQVFGDLTVIARDGSDAGKTAMWICKCSCGELRRIAGTGLRAGRNKSCGCKSPRFEVNPDTAGHTGSDTYSVWSGMLSRCSPGNKNSKVAKNYYLKGIRVCDRWMSFKNFVEDMGLRPNGLTIDRIDGNKGYELGNCRWADYKTQANNTSRNVFIEHNGERKTIFGWAEVVGISGNAMVHRLRRGWTIEKALSTKYSRRY